MSITKYGDWAYLIGADGTIREVAHELHDAKRIDQWRRVFSI